MSRLFLPLQLVDDARAVDERNVAADARAAVAEVERHRAVVRGG